MGQGNCHGEHDFVVTKLGAGIQRLECRLCDTVTVDLDAAEDGSVTAPGLFGPSRPTIFTVLAEEEREVERHFAGATAGTDGGPRFAFGGAARRR